jgi:catechol 2,3-dioxygenase-like lactoylglutathione lyase family enzyme
MSNIDVNTTTRTRFECGVPILRVQDLDASVVYYVETLGFTLDWQVAGDMASVSRDRAAVMLCQGNQGNPGTWVWMGVTDAQALYQEYVSAGACVPLPPTNYPWALEFHVRDPDRHVLRFGSEPMHDLPFSPWVAWYQHEPWAEGPRKSDGSLT